MNAKMNATSPFATPSAGSMEDDTLHGAEDKANPSHAAASAASVKAPTFPVTLHLMLSKVELGGIIAWLPHGRAWRILDQQAFKERVIPLYFRHGRFTSFARQISGWGFRRVSDGEDFNSYYHKVGGICSTLLTFECIPRLTPLPLAR